MLGENECYLCRLFYGTSNTRGLHTHHIFEGTGRRKRSDELGLTIRLCPMHHNASSEGVHFNKENDLILKRMAQEYYEAHIGTREDFRRDFIKSYL